MEIAVPNQATGFVKGQLCTRVHSSKTYIIFSLNNTQEIIHDLLHQRFS